MMLFKIPFLVANAYFASKALTAPGPPPPEEELVKDSEKKMAWASTYILMAERLVYTCLCLAECIVIVAQQKYEFSKASPIDLQFTLTFFFGCIATYSGALLRFWCFRELGRFFTFDFSIRKEHKLITSGPYAYVRHPSYTGYLMNVLGFFLCSFTRGSLVREWQVLWASPVMVLVVGVLALLRIARAFYVFERARMEDEGLEKEFGTEWDVWAGKVRYRILVGVF